MSFFLVSSQTATYPTRHYEEIGCTKVTNQPVLQYNCPFISKTLKPDKCYYGGKAIEVSKTLDVPGLPCWKYCICEKGMNQTCPGSAGFVCPVIDCFEFMMPPDTTQQCIWQHSHDECCSTGKVCGEEELNALPTCCDGTTKYKLGQVFYPENKCQKCICEKTKANPALAQFNCQNIKCAIGINDESSYQKCGPVYFEKRDCCPISWQCPNQNEDIIVKNTCPDKHNRKCHYGNKILNFGDKIKFKNDKCLECSCQVPPLVSCTRKAVCNP